MPISKPLRGFLGAVLVSTAVSFDAHAQQAISLVCKYEKSLNVDTLKTEGTSGEFSAQVKMWEPAPGRHVIAINLSKGPCFDFVGDADELEIRGECSMTMSNFSTGSKRLTRKLKISRMSGAFEEEFGFERVGLIHYGRCSVAKPLF